MNENTENIEENPQASSNVLRLRNIEVSHPPLQVPQVFTSQSQGSSSVRKRSSKLSKYGVGFQPPTDDAVHHAQDTKSLKFFEKGRDFESTYTNHKYTEAEKETLKTYESQDYLPSHSEVYKNWIKRQPSRTDWDQWLMMGLIGFIVGFVGFLLHQTIERLTDVRIERATEYLADSELLKAWGWMIGFSLLFLACGSALVVFVRPTAGGSGLPELICFLNGTQVRHIFNVKTLVIKFLSCCLSVGSGMPVGPEGPMIHLGSLVGAGVSQFKSDTLKIKFPFFERFRNSEDRRNFVSAGAAAGVSAAFGAPVGGLLFSMEEVSSFWNEKLSWQIFFCCMVSVFTSSLGNSAFGGFVYTGNFGLFKSTQYILFKVQHTFDFHVTVFVPATIIGILGGVFGSLFTFVNLKIARARKSILFRIQSKAIQKFCRLIEPITILVVYISISVFLPAAFECTQFKCALESNYSSENGSWCVMNPYTVGSNWSAELDQTQYYNCPAGEIYTLNDTYVQTTAQYNEVATLMMTNGERAIKHLFSRETHYEFGFVSLSVVFVIYFICACWSAGTAIASGLVVPMLLIGALYGRMVGLAMVYMFGVHRENPLWAWIDPGAMALIGSASFFGGVSRLTMSLTVIMFGVVPVCRLNLELYTAGHIMTKQVITLHDKESVQHIANILLDTTHSGFPVLSKSSTGILVFAGTISRLELTVLLKHRASFYQLGDNEANLTSDVTAVEYEQLTIDKLENPQETEDMLNDYASLPEYGNTRIFLRPYINQSAMSVKSNFSLHRTYIIFRSLGLRHLTITSVDGGQVVGMITRRDLMGFSLEEKLDKAPQSLKRFNTLAKTLLAFTGGAAQSSNETSSATNARHNLEMSPTVIPEVPESSVAATYHDLRQHPSPTDIDLPPVTVEHPNHTLTANSNSADIPMIPIDPASSDVEPLP